MFSITSVNLVVARYRVFEVMRRSTGFNLLIRRGFEGMTSSVTGWHSRLSTAISTGQRCKGTILSHARESAAAITRPQRRQVGGPARHPAARSQVGRRRSAPLRRGIQDNYAQHCGVQAPADSMKDSKLGELIEEESRWAESQVVPPEVPLFILRAEAKRIRAAWSKKSTP